MITLKIPNKSNINHFLHEFAEAACKSDGPIWARKGTVFTWLKKGENLSVFPHSREVVVDEYPVDYTNNESFCSKAYQELVHSRDDLEEVV